MTYIFFACKESTQQTTSQTQTATKTASKAIKKTPTDKRIGKFTTGTLQSAARGEVAYKVYLPPSWTADNKDEYPLLIWIHGQWGTEVHMPACSDVNSITKWMKAGHVKPMVIISLVGDDGDPENMQWYTKVNEKMLLGEGDNELRAFCHREFHTSMNPKKISVTGHSRGASGALYYALGYPEKFASAVAIAYVSDYNLKTLKDFATRNKKRIKDSGIGIKMQIGTLDDFAVGMNRRGTYKLGEHLTSLGIEHSLDVLEGMPHALHQIWQSKRADGKENERYQLEFHSKYLGEN